jgi:hypothetical protein
MFVSGYAHGTRIDDPARLAVIASAMSASSA